MTDTHRWGANPSDWAHFVSQGRVEDLLPVVADPKAKISQRSKMTALGKTPSRFNSDREAVGIPQWTSARTTEKEVKRWAADGDLGLCLQTRVWRAIDVDIADPVRAAEVQELVEMSCGRMHLRTRPNSGKRLLVFHFEGDLTKRIIRTRDGVIELLANGQQAIMVGTHVSGARYEWPAGLPGEAFPVAELTLSEIDVMWSGLMSVFGISQSEQRVGAKPTMPRSAESMYGDPLVAFLVENGWVKSFDRDGRVHVNCPWQADHTTESGDSASSYFPRGVGGFDQGNYVCLHAHCSEHRISAFEQAVGYVVEDFEVIPETPPPVVEPERERGVGRALGLFDTEEAWPVLTRVSSGAKKGRIECTANNMLLMLARPDIVRCRIALDKFKQVILIEWAPELVTQNSPGAEPGEWRPLGDSDYIYIQQQLDLRGVSDPSTEKVRAAVRAVASCFAFDSAMLWARGLHWDGVERIPGFFTRYMGVAASPYVEAVSAYMWTAMAGRCLVPGIKADMVPVFIGEQGSGKTSLVEALAPEPGAYLSVDLSHRDDNLARAMRGKLVGELGELRGLQTREAESIKEWLTRRSDEWVPKFVEFATVYERRILFIGTGNNEEFLSDPTGARRWLPMQVGKTDLEALVADRDQLWAEAVVRFEMEGIAWQDAHRLAQAEHEGFRVVDAIETDIQQWLETDGMDEREGVPRGDEPFHMSTLLAGLGKAGAGRADQMRVAAALKALGYKVKVAKDGARSLRMWVKT